MPIYEYKCGSCGHRFERLQRITDESRPDCPECGAPEAERLISAAGFLLKGSGWYQTDYPSEARKKGIEQEKKSSGSPPDAGTKKDGTEKTEKTEKKAEDPKKGKKSGGTTK